MLEQLVTPNAERDLAKRMQKKCDGLAMLDGDAKRVIEKAKAMIEAIPVAAREPCGCAVEHPSAWRLQEACWDMRRLEASIALYWLDNLPIRLMRKVFRRSYQQDINPNPMRGFGSTLGITPTFTETVRSLAMVLTA